jgi:hypothetical protein
LPTPHYVTGSPDGDMLFAQTDMGKYLETRAGQNAPTDFAKLLQQSGVDPASPLGRQLMQAQIAKMNNVPDEQGRPGGVVRDGITHQIMGVNPQSLPGGNSVIQNGQFTGAYTPAPGAAQIEATMAGAKSGGSAAGAVPYETVPTFNSATGQMDLTPKAATLGGGYSTTAPLGAPTFASTMGDAGGKYFSGLADAAGDAKNRIYALGQMTDLLKSGTQFGPGTDTAVIRPASQR